MSDLYATMRQPAPRPGDEVVLHTVLNRLGDGARSVLGDGLVARATFGKQVYGRYLETNNSRSALVDLYQELLDALMYLTQHQMEARSKWSVWYWSMRVAFFGVRWFAVSVKKKLDRERALNNPREIRGVGGL